jgi:DNA-binding NarL/FixJ family response regulator
MADPITVLIADDHPVVRKGLRSAIEEDEAFRVIHEAQRGDEALEQILALRPDIAILDIDMPEKSGIAVAREAREQQAATRIIFITFHSDQDLMRAAMEVGGMGYLLKESAIEEVRTAIQAVHAGRTFISSAMADILVRRSSTEGQRGDQLGIPSLTPTERKILRLIAEGNSSKDIGDTLSISYRTVENHRTNMCRKLNLEGANALSRFALQHRITLQERLL